jgi:CheY-like chemotaxis protein
LVTPQTRERGLSVILLIVDDNSQVRRLIRNLVEDLVDQCFECDDGTGALAAFVRHQPDWVLMDIQMKEMDGLAAIQQIKAAFCEARIIVVTDLDDPGLRAKAQWSGACGYVVKENLLQLRQLLAHKKPFTQEAK